MDVKGQLKRAQLENLTADPTPGIAGRVHYNTTDGIPKIDNGSAIKELLVADKVQIVTNKTIDADLNSIIDLQVGNLKAGVLDTDLTSVSASDDTIPSAKATKAYVDFASAAVVAAHEADSTAVHGIADTSQLVTIADAQTVSNKSVGDALTFAEVSTPSTPVAGIKVYAKSNNKLYQLSDLGVEQEVGSGSGASGINYIANPNGTSDTTGWKSAYRGKSVVLVQVDLTNNEFPIDTNFVNGDLVRYTATTGSIGGLVSGTSYYVVPGVTSSKSLSATLGGAAIDLTSRTGGPFVFEPVDLTKLNIENLSPSYGADTGAVTRNTSSPIRGAADFKYQSVGYGTIFYYDFTVDVADYSKTLSIGFDYKFGGTGFTSGSLKCYMVALANSGISGTNGALIEPVTSTIQSTTSSGTYQATFQTNPGYVLSAGDSLGYRLYFFQTDGLNTWDLQFSNVSVGPQIKAFGVPVTDPQSWTPTGGWTTNTFYTGRKWRVGNMGFYEVTVALTGAPGGTTGLDLNMPAGEVIDTTKITQTGGDYLALGEGIMIDNGVFSYDGKVGYQNTTSVSVYVKNASATYLSAAGVTKTVPMTWGSGDNLTVRWSVPIVGWSSNVVSSSDVGSRLVFFDGYVLSNTALTANVTNVPYTAVKDTHGAWTGSTYVVKEAGDYDLDFTAINTTTAATYKVYVNGSLRKSLTSVTTTTVASTSVKIANLVVGDIVSVRADTGCTITGSTTLTTLSIAKIGTVSQQIGLDASVSAHYTNSAGSSVGTSTTAIPFATRVTDTHGLWVTDTFTAQTSGIYRVRSKIRTAAVTLTTSQRIALEAYKGGSLYRELGYVVGNGVSNSYSVGGDVDVPMLAGETIKIQGISSVATTLNTTAAYNYVCINRVANYA